MTRMRPARCSAPRDAYSILELMIALSLMSVLLLLGWSLMQSIQDAETRSWKLTQRIRVLRTTRAWLADDMDHLVQTHRLPTATSARQSPLGGALQQSMERFEGDATGFIATISPSLDPIRFFDRLVSSPDALESRASEGSSIASLLESESEIAVREARESLWPEQGIDVEYRLERVDSSDENSQNAIQNVQDLQFELVRREWLISKAKPADRALSSRDLYRGLDGSDETFVPPLKETRLYGMVQAAFYYFDGSSWSQEWNSLERGDVPKAIAISFDFPARAEFERPEKTSADRRDGDGAWSEGLGGENLDSSVGNPTPVLDPASQETSLGAAKDRLVESSEREYVLVVETGNRTTPPPVLTQSMGVVPR